MAVNTNSRREQVVSFFKAFGTILGLPLALFTFVNSFVAQPVTALVVAVVMAVLALVMTVLFHWAGFIEVIVAWLTLFVIILAGFIIWPRTP